jgi:hypothetical protein
MLRQLVIFEYSHVFRSGGSLMNQFELSEVFLENLLHFVFQLVRFGINKIPLLSILT